MIALILFGASFIQGVIGFGFALVALPLLAFVMDVKEVVVLLVAQSLIQNSVALGRLYPYVQWKRMLKLVLIAALMIPLGVYLLKLFSARTILLFASLVMFVFYILPVNKLPLKLSPSAAAVLAATSSGLLNSTASASGPPMILYLSAIGMPKQNFRANLMFYFFLLNIITLVSFFFNDLLTPLMLKQSAFYGIAVLLGSALGVSAGNHIKEPSFARLVKIGFVVITLVNIYKALQP